jgi:hypothetical protein
MCLATLAPAAGASGAAEAHLVVGTAAGLRFFPTDCDAAYLRVYRVLDEGKRLELLHKTQASRAPASRLLLCPTSCLLPLGFRSGSGF